jgi:hypothetical protein
MQSKDEKTVDAAIATCDPDRAKLPQPGCAHIETPLETNAPAVLPVSELDQWVSAERLLEILWDEQSRPSLQWIRKETKRRMLPFIRRGRLIFYRPRSVMEWFNQRECRPHSMK